MPDRAKHLLMGFGFQRRAKMLSERELTPEWSAEGRKGHDVWYTTPISRCYR